MINSLLLAGAGTGKTTYIVEKALENNDRTLITTYTNKCRNEIKTKIIEKIGYVPDNIYIQTWFSFLIEHGIMPYKKDLKIKNINGLSFCEGKSGLKYYIKNKIPVYWGEEDFEKHYFDNHKRVYSDKLAKLVIRIDDASKGLVFQRIDKIFKNILIDEVQDLVGYDLEILKKLFQISCNIVMVGDPRQNVYDTHVDSKYKKYSNGNIDDFVKNECKKFNCTIDADSLNICRRCHKDIVTFINNFYPEYKALQHISKDIKEHQGIYIVKSQDVAIYLKKYSPMQLRFDKRKKTNIAYSSMNFRNSKGCTFSRSIIYPTQDLGKYLETENKILKVSTKNILYVAMSRSEDSLAFVYDGKVSPNLNLTIWDSNDITKV